MEDTDGGASESFNPLIGVPKGEWSQGLFEVNSRRPWGHTLYACCCPCFAIAESRRLMAGSDVYFNHMCVSACATRWLLRSAYDIPGTAWMLGTTSSHPPVATPASPIRCSVRLTKRGQGIILTTAGSFSTRKATRVCRTRATCAMASMRAAASPAPLVQ